MFGQWFFSNYDSATSAGFQHCDPADEKQFACEKCGELFRSKVALRRHETYVCNNTNAIFSTLNREFRQSQAAAAAAAAAAAKTSRPASSTSPTSGFQQVTSGPSVLTSSSSEPSLPAQLAFPPTAHPQERCGRDLQHTGEMIEEGQRHRQFVLDSSSSPQPPTTAARRTESTSTPSEPETADLGIFGSGKLKHFPCENCDKVFTDPSNLQRHIRSTHVGARSHTCNECGKTFATSSGLKQHQHIHSSVKPFQCEVCLKAYTQFSNLCRHKRMHADCRQQIKCKDCGQAFSTMTSLSKHKRFCEGMLRNGARFSFPPSTPEKTAPTAVGANPMASQASALTAAYMNFYGPRPPFPFYPPLGHAGFPLFPPGHPLTAMTPPVLPDPKFPTSSSSPNMAAGSPNNTSTPRKYLEDKPSVPSSKAAFHSGSEGTDLSDVSTPNHSDIESHGSDADSESELDKTSDTKPSAAAVPSVSSPKPAGLASKSSSQSCPPSKSPHLPPSTSVSPVSNMSPKSNKAENSTDSGLLDLSKSSSGSGDQPLDLSTKIKKEVLPDNTPRRTHIFGGQSRKRALSEETASKPAPQATPEKKPLHQAYPAIPTPIMMDQMYRAEKDKMQSFHEAARMMTLPRFPLPQPLGPIPGIHGMLHRGPFDPLKNMSPMMKLDHSSEAFPYSHGVSKLKDRYSCKFCGKIFPRSANLTRHLRTHTGEQPYKCKYCERSFSISSNLQRHVRNIHNKEKPFKCPLCDRCFGQQTNLDRHLKKHESEGPNVIDSPPQGENDLDEKEESYFDEIRNFIGKATSDGRESPKKEYSNIDANFSIMAQIEKQKQLKEEKTERRNGSEEEDLVGEDLMNEEEDLEDEMIEDEEDGALISSKRSHLENNNDDSGLEQDKAVNLTNGFHKGSELSKHLNGHYDVKSLTTPLTIST